MKVQAKAGADFDDFYAKQAATNPAGRFGTAEEFGEACAFLCSAQAVISSGKICYWMAALSELHLTGTQLCRRTTIARSTAAG